MRDRRSGRTLTTTPFRAATVVAVVAVIASTATAAFGAIGDGGVIQACYDRRGALEIVSALPCPKGLAPLGQIYTKAGADATFLTAAAADSAYLGKSATAADADELDGMDSSEFLPYTNCLGYPHAGIDWHGCDLVGANLDDATLFQADLSGADLRSAGLIEADLRYADLSGADLRFGANLWGAHMEGANVANVRWQSTCPDGTSSDANGGTCEGHLGDPPA
jgi:hypothetical protein